MRKPLVEYTMILVTILAIFFSSNFSKQFEVDPKLSEQWLKNARDKFNPESWNNSMEVESKDQFMDIITRNKEVYVFFYNRKDNTTFSLSPFFKTTSMALHDDNPSFPIITIDMEKTSDIAELYGIPPTHSIIMYFYQKAPIVVKFDQMEKSSRPIQEWMKKVKTKVEKVQVIRNQDDLDMFENMNKLVLLIVDKEQESLANTFAALSFNYFDLNFSFILRDEETVKLEKEINDQFDVENHTSGSKHLFLLFCN